jgi:hypothetical protein
MALSDKAQREIRKIAYSLWMQEGQPSGRDREHWEAAKVIWAFETQRHEEVSVPASSGESGQMAADAERRQQGQEP